MKCANCGATGPDVERLRHRNSACIERLQTRVEELEVLVYDLASRPCRWGCDEEQPCETCRARDLMSMSSPSNSEGKP